MSAVLFLLAAAQAPAAACGRSVIGAYSDSLPLTDANGTIQINLPSRHQRLPDPLPILECDASTLMVRYHDKTYFVDAWRVLKEQDPCKELSAYPSIGGEKGGKTTATSSNTSGSNAFDPNKFCTGIKR